jgi:hypothetical protein
MNIQLKQEEIVKALEQYITAKGFSLVGKTVKIDFTAGRKAGGLIADLVIEDEGIPGFNSDDPEETKSVTGLSVVEGSKNFDYKAASKAALEADISDDAVEVTPTPVEEPEAPKPSLFS